MIASRSERTEMETNETIVTKQVVSLDDAGQVGTVSGLVINAETRAISHYLIASAANGTLALPFDRALSVGDTFLILQSEDDLTSAASAQEAENSFDLVGLPVFSVAGNKIGTVESYEIDTIYGDIVKIFLDDESEFVADEFVFFSPNFVFVNDGSKTDAELRGIAARANRGGRSVVHPLG